MNVYILILYVIVNISNTVLPFNFKLQCKSTENFGSIEPKINNIQETEQIIRKERRIRYSGKYPKSYSEKYKEQRGDSDIISKVISKGGTPAGMHVPIMLKQCLEYLNILESSKLKTEQTICVDCTLGFGGHSSGIIKNILPSGGKLYAIDQDSIEIQRTESRIRQFLNNSLSDPNKLQIAQSSIIFNHGNFKDIKDILQKHNIIGRVNCLLADLGFSSMQIDNPDRGFSYKFDGPLDMRMNPLNTTLSAADYLELVDEEELSYSLQENSDEALADAIASAIKTKPIPETTLQLAECVRRVYTARKFPKDAINSAIARTMQAVRIAVNEEFEALDSLLEALPHVLAPGGRAVFLTFHSGEDRRVKKAFKGGYIDGIYSAWSRDVVRPEFEEQHTNPRSKCAKLRWVIRSDKPVDDDSDCGHDRISDDIDESLNEGYMEDVSKEDCIKQSDSYDDDDDRDVDNSIFMSENYSIASSTDGDITGDEITAESTLVNQDEASAISASSISSRASASSGTAAGVGKTTRAMLRRRMLGRRRTH